MKKLLNTLYVTSEGAYLSRKGETIQVRVENQLKLSIPIHTLDGVVCFGPVMCTPAAMGLCAGKNVAVSFLSMHGRFLARVQGPVSGNVLLRREQYRQADDPSRATEISRSIVIAKIANSRAVMMRARRDRPNSPGADLLAAASKKLATTLKRLHRVSDLDSVRAKEGSAAWTYFSVFDNLITSQKDEFAFTQRSRRPPLDRINALLSFLYTLLAHDVRSALETVGLDPAVGFLHKDRPGRPGLALDLMEEFRPVLADRLALSLINRRQIVGSEFRTTETGAVLMNEHSRKTLLVAYQKRKQEIITHPFLGEKVSLGLLPHVQAVLLARHVRGDMDGYAPFLWK